ncbi:Hypothetical protein FKW44_006953 [Caligus rogercresseyi]|uniref:Uncharacterized protein n=1 Tax=Caligus rogercresseyi TaxID=217165 RepID=A0A7T8QT80_CALRO|nr:Hypothetical protein FKW44_006953 [Caligus rogercresseyi]
MSLGPNAAHRAIQVALNDAARSIFGCKRRDHIHVGDLLERAGLPSLNEVAAKAVTLVTWNAFTSTTVAVVPGTRLVTSSSPSRRGP